MKYWPTIFALALLAGCARFQPEPISAEKSAASFDARSLTNEDLRAFLETNQVAGEWRNRRWDLNALTYVAFYYQPSLAETRAQLASVRAAEITAGQRPNPSLTATPTYDTSSSPPWIPGVSFDVPIETAGKRSKRIAQAVFATEAAKWNFVATEWEVRSKVRAALLNLRVAGETESLLARAETAQSNVLRLLQGQLSAGAISSFEVTQARVAAETTQLARRDAIGQLRQGRVQLAGVLGLPSSALEGIDFDYGALEELPLSLTAPEIRREAVLHRADIRSALAGYAVAREKSAIAKTMLEDLHKQLDSVRAQAQLGEADALALANAEVSYDTGAQNELEALAKAQEALGTLEDAVQSPFTFSMNAVRSAPGRLPETKK